MRVCVCVCVRVDRMSLAACETVCVWVTDWLAVYDTVIPMSNPVTPSVSQSSLSLLIPPPVVP
jgi:hypothetical protein